MQVSGELSRLGARTLVKGSCVALLGLAVACGGGSDATGPGGGGGNSAPVASVSLSPGSANLLVGVEDTTTLSKIVITPTVKDASGNVLSGRSITWSSSAQSVATVNSTGVVSAVGPGTASISASSGGQNGQISVTVTRPVVDTITVSPLTSTIKVGSSETLAVTPLDAQGHILSGRILNPHNNSQSTIGVNGGTITGLAAGTGTVSYSSENKTTTATITVTP